MGVEFAGPAPQNRVQASGPPKDEAGPIRKVFLILLRLEKTNELRNRFLLVAVR
jgi:hypothetical protein